MQIIWYRLPLALKIAVPMALLSLLSALSIVAITQYNQQRLIHERTDQLGNALAERMAASAARPLVQNDAVSLQAALAEFVAEPVVQRAVVFDLKQQLIASAGAENPASWDYSATIHWQDSAIGRALLSLRPSTTHSDYPQLADLLLLASILTALSAVCGLWLGHRAENLLIDLTRKLSGEQIDFKYRGTDALARVLAVSPPPLLTTEPKPLDSAMIALHIWLPDSDEISQQQALTLIETIGDLYGGKTEVTRARGVTARFPIDDDSEGAFRAVCSAQLLQLFSQQQVSQQALSQQQAGSKHNFRIALAVLAADEANNKWRSQACIERLHSACETAADDWVLIDAQLQRHPEIAERCVLEEVANNFWHITALNSPYDVLLERQFATLSEQINT